MTKYLKHLIIKTDKHEIFVMAPALAYATALALAPFVLIILSIISFLDHDLQSKFTLELTTAFGGEVGTAVKSIIENVDQHPKISGLSGLIGFFILFISASAIFTQLRIALDKINEFKGYAREDTVWTFLRGKFWSVGLVLAFAFLSIASMLVTAFIGLIYPNGEGVLWHMISFGVNFVLFTLVFTAIFRYIPSEHLSFKRCLFSGAVSTVFYLLGKTLISLYLGKAGLGSPYGAAGSLIVFLAWVYYTAITLLVSYEISTYALTYDENNHPSVSAKTAKVT